MTQVRPWTRCDRTSAPDDTAPATGATQADKEATLRECGGSPLEAMILVPAFTTPMRQPEQPWAMLVLAVDIGPEQSDIGIVVIAAGGICSAAFAAISMRYSPDRIGGAYFTIKDIINSSLRLESSDLDSG